MAMIDKVMDELLKQGFMPKHENFGIAFKYQMTNYLYVQDKKDEDYFSLYVPYIFNVNSENMAEVLSTINAINNAMKVIKLVVTNDNIVWACFEENSRKMQTSRILFHLRFIHCSTLAGNLMNN